MNILHILTSCNAGGIEVLCKAYLQYSQHSHTIATLFGGGCIADEIRENGGDVVELQGGKQDLFLYRRRILDLCRERNVEVAVVHHSSPISHLLLMEIKRIYPHIQTVAYTHGNGADMVRTQQKRGLWLRKAILSRSLKQADKVAAVSESVKASLTEYFGIGQQKVSVIYNGVETSRYQVPAKLQERDGPLTILYVGRLEAVKGVQNILDQLAELKEEIPFLFTVVGGGSYRKALEAQAERLGIANQVDFLGIRRDIPKLLAQGDVFVHLPDWQEGFGLTVVEAMAAGLACIGNRRGALPEIIQDGVNGFLVEETPGNNFRDILLWIYERKRTGDPDGELTRIRKNAKLRAREFGIETYAKRMDMFLLKESTGEEHP